MANSEEKIHDLLNNHPLAPLHAKQIYLLMLENGNNITLEEVEKTCDCMYGKEHVLCEEIKCYSAQE